MPPQAQPQLEQLRTELREPALWESIGDPAMERRDRLDDGLVAEIEIR